MKNICIYHKSCADGFGAALAVKLHFDYTKEKCKFLSAHYGDEVPDVTGMNVIIVDFSYPRDVLLKMKDQAESIIVLDHHKTAEENLKGLDFCVFDMTKSGAMLAWEHFHDFKAPRLIQYIQDRDLWKWELENTRAVSCGLQLLPFEFEAWEKYLNDEAIGGLVRKGNTIIEYQEQQISRATDPSKYRMVDIEGYTVPLVNTTTLISEICGRLAEGYPFAVSYFDTPTDRIYSLRRRDSDVDVSSIAKKFGGGGHAAAAGFSIPLKEKQF